MYWLLDLDDTLASGPMTWALQDAIPRLIRDYNLAYTQDQLDDAILTAQRRSNQEYDPLTILHDFFVEMNWRTDLEQTLFNAVQTGYQPALFADALPFLQKLQALGQQAMVVSNNNRAPKWLTMLGIDSYITAVYTPKMFPDCQPKPNRQLWDVITEQHPHLRAADAVMVGDDPWSDGDFAERCGMKCWILDRLGRYQTLYAAKQYQWCASLLEIPLERG
jgi:FMN phosphatase YigB (HAD superfamily)